MNANEVSDGTHHLGSRMQGLYALQNCRAVIRDDQFALGSLDLWRGALDMNIVPMNQTKPSRTILSIPLGPSDVRTASLMAIHALCQHPSR